jgi:DUF2934 family protein
MGLENKAPWSTHANHVVQPQRQKPADGWVREAAYFIWEKEGRVHGHALDHWLRAENEVRRLVDSGKVRGPAR